MNTSNIVYGIIVLVACLLLKDKLPYIGNLPGDFYFRVGQVQVFAPIASMLVITLVLSFIRSILH